MDKLTTDQLLLIMSNTTFVLMAFDTGKFMAAQMELLKMVEDEAASRPDYEECLHKQLKMAQHG